MAVRQLAEVREAVREANRQAEAELYIPRENQERPRQEAPQRGETATESADHQRANAAPPREPENE